MTDDTRSAKAPVPHPGKELAKILASLNLSASALAMELRVPANRITLVLAGMRSISPDTAIRLAHYLGGKPEDWLDLQRDFDLDQVERESGDMIRSRITPISGESHKLRITK